MFRDMDPALGAEGEEYEHQNLRRGLKAEAMKFGIPTQLVWPRTVQLVENENSIPVAGLKVKMSLLEHGIFMTAIYHKAGGIPWRLANIEQGTCFVGVSFYRENRPA